MSTPISRSLSPSQSTEDPPLFIPYNFETTPTPPITDIVSVASTALSSHSSNSQAFNLSGDNVTPYLRKSSNDMLQIPLSFPKKEDLDGNQLEDSLSLEGTHQEEKLEENPLNPPSVINQDGESAQIDNTTCCSRHCSVS